MDRTAMIQEGNSMSVMRRLCVSLALCAVLGCAGVHGPSESIADALPAPLEDAAAAAASPEPKTAEEVAPGSLGGVLSRIDSVASALAISRARAEGSRAAVEEALGLYWGELRAFVRDVHFNSRRLVNPLAPPIQLGNLPFDSEQIGAGLEARIPIDLDGSIASTVRVQKEGEKVARRTVEAVRLQLFGAGAQLYRGVQALRADREALEEQGRSLDERIRVAREALAVGRLAKVELLRLQAERERVNGQIATLEGRIEGARARLAAAMRLDAYTEELDRVTEPPPSPDSVPVNLAARPDIQAALHRFDQARARLDQVEASYRPRLGIDSQVLFNAGYDVPGEVTWQVATALDITLFDGGRRSARMRAVEADVKAARHALQDLYDRARAEVASARASWRAAKARNEAAVRAQAASAENARIQRERFNDGRLSAVDLVDAEADLARASAEVKTSLIDWWSAFDALRLAVGLPPLTAAPVPDPVPDPDLDAEKEDRP
ncbi:MAG TPA: TolC family protein [Planctomycetes bacterium]|nr:TolC family protein [Planctomycetota bacterium]